MPVPLESLRVLELDSGSRTALVSLADELEWTGYTEVLASFFPHELSPASWHRAAAGLSDPLRGLLGLFLLGESVGTQRLPREIRTLLPPLARAGFCVLDGSRARLPGLALVRPQGNWMWAQRPTYAPTIYLGDDSLGLAHRQSGRREHRWLDLCAGPGVQSVIAASRGAHVVAVEINPIAAGMARANLVMNGLENAVEVRTGDLYTAVEGETFDGILANPPLLPIPEGISYPFVGDGGPDGMRAVRRILDGLPAHLAPRGEARLIGAVLSDGFVPLAADELDDWASRNGFRVQMVLTAHLSTAFGGPWVQGVAETIGAYCGMRQDKAARHLADSYSAAGASHIAMYHLRLRRGEHGLELIDLSPDPDTGHYWFV